MRFAWILTTLFFVFFSLYTNASRGHQDGRQHGQDRFVITELKPNIDTQMANVKQVYMCAEARVHQNEMEPSPRGGVTKTRVAVRSEKKGSTYLILDDREPGYRMFQVFMRGFIERALAWVGAEHVLLGSVSFAGFGFESDPAFPLHFKYVNHMGYVHLAGRGTVTTPKGVVHTLNDPVDIPRLSFDLKSGDQLSRESACIILGYVLSEPSEKRQMIPALLDALVDEAMEVRRNAAEALGKIGALSTLDGLRQLLQDDSEWVREVSAHAIEQITKKSHS